MSPLNMYVDKNVSLHAVLLTPLTMTAVLDIITE